jgi:hypothetical protein
MFILTNDNSEENKKKIIKNYNLKKVFEKIHKKITKKNLKKIFFFKTRYYDLNLTLK